MRWCRGSISERILQPLVRRIEAHGGVVLGGRKVLEVMASAGSSKLDR